MTMKYSNRHEATGAQRRGQPQAPREAGQAFGHTRRAGAEDTGEYDSRTSARGVGEAGREEATTLKVGNKNTLRTKPRERETVIAQPKRAIPRPLLLLLHV